MNKLLKALQKTLKGIAQFFPCEQKDSGGIILTVNKKTFGAIQKVTARQGHASEVDTIRHALALYDLATECVTEEGSTLIIKDQTGKEQVIRLS